MERFKSRLHGIETELSVMTLHESNGWFWSIRILQWFPCHSVTESLFLRIEYGCGHSKAMIRRPNSDSLRCRIDVPSIHNSAAFCLLKYWEFEKYFASQIDGLVNLAGDMRQRFSILIRWDDGRKIIGKFS